MTISNIWKTFLSKLMLLKNVPLKCLSPTNVVVLCVLLVALSVVSHGLIEHAYPR